MKAAVCTAYGAPDVLEIRDVPKPVPKGRRGAGSDPRHDGEHAPFVELHERHRTAVFAMSSGAPPAASGSP
jgi:hypothetical protein